jgi:lipopolysaccharide cholinephosphotransferase
MSEDLRRIQQVLSETLKELTAVLDKNNLRYIMIYGSLIGTVRHNGFIPWDDDLDIAMPREDYEKFKSIAKDVLPSHLFLQDYSTDKEFPALVAKVRNSNTTLVENGYRKLRKMNHGMFVDIFVTDYYEPSIMNSFRQKAVRAFKGILLAQKVYKVNKLKKAIAVLFPRNLLFRKIDKMLQKMDKKGVRKHYLIDNSSILDASIFDDILLHDFEGFKVRIPASYDKILTQQYGDYMTPPPIESRKPYHITEHVSCDIPYKVYLETHEKL